MREVALPPISTNRITLPVIATPNLRSETHYHHRQHNRKKSRRRTKRDGVSPSGNTQRQPIPNSENDARTNLFQRLTRHSKKAPTLFSDETKNAPPPSSSSRKSSSAKTRERRHHHYHQRQQQHSRNAATTAASGCSSKSFATTTSKRNKKRSKSRQRRRTVEKAAAKTIQKRIRGVLARKRFKTLKRKRMFRMAQDSGVLLACEGTVQGESGWYQMNETSAPVYYRVDEFGEWTLVKK